jgi:hypothetical protein
VAKVAAEMVLLVEDQDFQELQLLLELLIQVVVVVEVQETFLQLAAH